MVLIHRRESVVCIDADTPWTQPCRLVPGDSRVPAHLGAICGRATRFTATPSVIVTLTHSGYEELGSEM